MAKQKWQYQSGRWYRFLLGQDPINDFPPHINFPGTYAVFIGNECFYIGQSVDILKRLKNHIRMARFTSTWKTPWGYYPRILIAVRRERFRYERLAVEKRLIEKFRPKYNVLLKNNNE